MLMDAIQTVLFGSMSWVLIPFFCIQQLSNTVEAVGMQVVLAVLQGLVHA